MTEKEILTHEDTGATYSLVRPPQRAVQAAREAIPVPQPPQIPHPNTEIGGTVPNWDDPNYAREMLEHEGKMNMAGYDAMLVLGIKIETMPEDDEWLEELQEIGVATEVDSGNQRSVENAFKKYVLGDSEVTSRLTKLMGVTQEQLDQAAENFSG